MAIEDIQTKQELLAFIQKEFEKLPKQVPSAWNGPIGLTSGWTGSAYYRIDVRTGIVDFKGQISPGTATDGTLIFTMPAGFRPLQECVFPVVHRGGSGGTSWVRVSADGTVRLVFNGSSQPNMDVTPLRYSTF